MAIPHPTTLEIVIDPASLRKLERDLDGMAEMIPTVLQRAVNRGVSAGMTEMVKVASDRLGIGRRIIRERVWGSRARIRGNLTGRIRGGKVGWPLRRLGPVQTSTGVDVTLGGQTKSYPHAFILPEKFGGAVVRRYPKGSSGPKGGRLFTVRTDDVTTAVVTAALEPQVKEAALAACMKRLDEEVRKLLSGTE